MKNIINKAFLLSLTALILTGCHVHTTKTIPDLPTKASVKIETGAAITFCDDTGSRCDTARMMTGSGSGVIISHHKNNTFSLTAGHVCDFGAERPPLPPLSSPQEIAAFAGSIGVHLDFVPSKMESSWLIFILDIDFNKHFAVPTSVISPRDNRGSGTTVDLCLLVSQRVDVAPAKLSNTTPESGDRIYNIASPYGTFFKGDGGMLYQGILTSPKGMNGSSVFSIPAAPGSSGSPIFNSEGEIIGIVSAVHRLVPNQTIGASIDQIRCFLYNSFEAAKLPQAAPHGSTCE